MDNSPPPTPTPPPPLLQTPSSPTNDSSSTEDPSHAERRASIKKIMADESLTPLERRRSIQSLMDGRRRSSFDRRSSRRDSPFGVVSTDGSTGSITNGSAGSITGGVDPIVAAVAAASHADDDTGSQGRRRGSSRRPSTVSLPGVIEDEDYDDDMATFYLMYGTQDARNSMRMEKGRPACEHYDRKCTLIAPCCGMAFGCRICHDECPNLPAPVLLMTEEAERLKAQESGGGGAAGQQRSMSLPSYYSTNMAGCLADAGEETHHEIDRFKVKEVICRECFTRQSSKTNHCISCNVRFGEYHCSICNLWMSNAESPYHCHSCGFCRIGGRENFKHCDNCGMCIDVTLFAEHNCKSGRYMSNCPVCQEDLFSSRAASHELPCGHAMHWHCFEELTSFDSRCPVCKKTAETREEMQSTWNAMAMSIAMQPVPEDMAKVVVITCNDCERRQENRRWHFLGVQCRHCESFNTNVEEVQMTGTEAVMFLRGASDDSTLTAEEAREAFAAALEAARDQGEEITEEMEEMAEEMARLDFRMLIEEDGGSGSGGEDAEMTAVEGVAAVQHGLRPAVAAAAHGTVAMPRLFGERSSPTPMATSTGAEGMRMEVPASSMAAAAAEVSNMAANEMGAADSFATNMDVSGGDERRPNRRRRASEGPQRLQRRGAGRDDFRFFNLRDL